MGQTLKKKRIIFIARKVKEAVYWAREWGFSTDEWAWIDSAWHVRGLQASPGEVVFACGTGKLDRLLLDSLAICGYNIIVDAHDLSTSYDPRSALDLLEVE